MSAGMGEKYLVFALGEEQYAVDILKVREIVRMTHITPLPHSPPFVRGVINLRGRVIPVIDLRARFGLQPREYTERTCIVVVEPHGSPVGMAVDEVLEVAAIAPEQVDPPAVQGPCLRGVARCDGRVRLLLDLERVCSLEEGTG